MNTTNTVTAVNRHRYSGQWGVLSPSGKSYNGYSHYFKYGEMENVVLAKADNSGCALNPKSGIALGQLVKTANQEPVQFPALARPLKFKNQQFFDVLTRQTITECSKLFLLVDGRSLYLP